MLRQQSVEYFANRTVHTTKYFINNRVYEIRKIEYVNGKVKKVSTIYEGGKVIRCAIHTQINNPDRNEPENKNKN